MLVLLCLLNESAFEHHDKHQDKQRIDLTDTRIAVLKALKEKTLSRKSIFKAIGMTYDSGAIKLS